VYNNNCKEVKTTDRQKQQSRTGSRKPKRLASKTKGADTVGKQRKPKKRQKKSGNQDRTTKTIILTTAILQLIKTIIDLMRDIIN
jgi:hypothetical protein